MVLKTKDEVVAGSRSSSCSRKEAREGLGCLVGRGCKTRRWLVCRMGWMDWIGDPEEGGDQVELVVAQGGEWMGQAPRI